MPAPASAIAAGESPIAMPVVRHPVGTLGWVLVLLIAATWAYFVFR